MAVSLEYICETCREVHLVPRSKVRDDAWQQTIADAHVGHKFQLHCEDGPSYNDGPDLVLFDDSRIVGYADFQRFKYCEDKESP